MYQYCTCCNAPTVDYGPPMDMFVDVPVFIAKWTCQTCGSTKRSPKKWVLNSKTQKGKGLAVLSNLSTGVTVAPILRLFSSEDEINEWNWGPKLTNLFARPCPVRPRHGFVDSRVVRLKEELLTVMRETKEADPDGEVMLMYLIDAEFNSVWTPSLLTIGEGNDGATAGKNVITIPLGGINPLNEGSKYALSGIGEDEDPYVEAVYAAEGETRLTQLRAGPKGDSRVDFIPVSVLIKEVLVPNGMDLLKWEDLIRSKASDEGVVVWNSGGSPTDHYSVHARTFGMAAITSFEPVIGSVLNPVPFVPPSPLSVLRGLITADTLGLNNTNTSKAVTLLLLALHGSARMEGEQGKWLGIGVGLLLRLGATALRGEARHIRENKGDRSAVYARCLPHTIRRHRAALPRLVNILRYGDFGGGGVGGRAWAECGGALATLFDAVGVLAKNKNEDSVNKLLRAFNIAVNQAHNGGWWLNKFASATAFDTIQKGSLNYPVNAAPFLYEVGDLERKLDQTIVDRKVNNWAKWEPVSLKHDTIQAVQVGIIPGLPGISFSITDRLLKNKHRPLVIPAKNVIEAITTAAGGSVYIVPTHDGMSLEFRRDGQPPVVLWKEKSVREGGKGAFNK